MKDEIKNLKKIAERILKAIENKEKIILYGDADTDGVSSVIILKEGLEDLGLSPAEIYFPDREKEGYGINEKALGILANQAPALFIALDCGIGNIKEVEIAKKIGFEIIIIDHHKALLEIPKTPLICDPKQEGDKYPFKELATAGLAYKLIKTLFSLAEKKYKPENFLELTALATLADLMPLEDENEKLVEEGILALNFTERPGLKALMEISNFKNIDLREVRQKIISPLNAALAKNHSNEAYLLLIEKDITRAKQIAQNLIEKAQIKKEQIKKITREIEARIDSSQTIIFEGDKDWPLVLLGPVASRICQQYKKPTFLFKKRKEDSPGTVRMPSGLDGVEAMINCRQLLKTYGGHPPAAGFRLKNENLEKFKKCLTKYFRDL